MRHWLLIAILTVCLIGIGIYTWPHMPTLLARDGDLTVGVAGGLAMLIVQLICTKLIVDSAVDRVRLHAKRDALEDLKEDARRIIELYLNVQDEYTGVSTPLYHKLHERVATGSFGTDYLGIDLITLSTFVGAVASPATATRVTFLSSVLDGDHAHEIADYLGRRAEVAHSFQRTLDSPNTELGIKALFSAGTLPETKAQGDIMTLLEVGWFLKSFLEFIAVVDRLKLHESDHSKVSDQAKHAYNRYCDYFTDGEPATATAMAG